MPDISDLMPGIPQPPIHEIEGQFKEGANKGKGTVSLNISPQLKQITVTAKDHMPTGIWDKFLNLIGSRRWVPVHIREAADKDRDIYVNVEELAKQLGCSESSIRKAAEVAESGAKGELESWLSVAQPYAKMKNAFHSVLSREQIRTICRTIQANGKAWVDSLKEAQQKTKEVDAMVVGTDKKPLNQRKIQQIPVTIHVDPQKGFVISLLGAAHEGKGELGVGSFKEVHRAFHFESGAVVAYAMIKTRDPKRQAKAEIALEQESYLMDQLAGCKHVVQAEHRVTYEDSAGVAHKGIMMEYCDNGELTSFIKDTSDPFESLDFEENLDFADDVLCGLAECHARGVVHCDLKPQNILVSKEGDRYVAKLADFGMGFKPGDTSGKCRTEGHGGTIQFDAPEKLRDGKAKNGKVDSFSAGCVLYMLIFGKQPPWFSEVDKLIKLNKAIEKRLGSEDPRLEEQLIDIDAELQKWHEKHLPDFVKKLGRAEFNDPVEMGKIIAALLDPDPDERITPKEAWKQVQALRKAHNIKPVNKLPPAAPII